MSTAGFGGRVRKRLAATMRVISTNVASLLPNLFCPVLT